MEVSKPKLNRRITPSIDLSRHQSHFIDFACKSTTSDDTALPPVMHTLQLHSDCWPKSDARDAMRSSDIAGKTKCVGQVCLRPSPTPYSGQQSLIHIRGETKDNSQNGLQDTIVNRLSRLITWTPRRLNAACESSFKFDLKRVIFACHSLPCQSKRTYKQRQYAGTRRVSNSCKQSYSAISRTSIIRYDVIKQHVEDLSEHQRRMHVE